MHEHEYAEYHIPEDDNTYYRCVVCFEQGFAVPA
jgi:hypothetical protein